MNTRTTFPIVAVLALAALPAQAQPADWVGYGQSESGSYYFDRSSLRAEGERRRVWRLFALREPQAGVQSGKALIEFRCQAGTYRYLRTLYYSGPMGDGRYLGGAREQSDEPVTPGSMIGELAARVCA